jgi:hypothetical protein
MAGLLVLPVPDSDLDEKSSPFSLAPLSFERVPEGRTLML